MQLGHAVIMVSDLDASLPWYAAVLAALGFDKTRDHVWVNEAGQALDLNRPRRSTRRIAGEASA